MNISQNMEQRIKLLFEKYLSDTATAEERRELNDWIANNESLASWFKKKLDSSSDKMDEEVQAAILEKINREISAKSKKRKRFSYPSWLRYAAVFAFIIIGIGGIFTYRNYSQNLATQYVEIITPYGQKAVLTLPDGTRVTLNSDSKIKFSAAYNKKNRNIELLGEAFFDVEKNDKLPFVVQAEYLYIQAIGTAFNVKAYPNEKLISTTLTEGKLLVTSEKGEISMLPNERIEYNKEHMSLDKVNLQNAENSIGWMNDKLSFDNATLEEVVADFIRIYKIDIQFASENIKQHRFSGQINNDDLKEVLHVISLSSPIRVEYTDSIIKLHEVPAESKLFGK